MQYSPRNNCVDLYYRRAEVERSFKPAMCVPNTGLKKSLERKHWFIDSIRSQTKQTRCPMMKILPPLSLTTGPECAKVCPSNSEESIEESSTTLLQTIRFMFVNNGFTHHRLLSFVPFQPVSPEMMLHDPSFPL
jgi:hypothetical protein